MEIKPGGSDPLAVPSLSDAIGDFLAGVTAALTEGPVEIGTRYPVTRSGPRDEIPRTLRRLVWYRDRGRCRLCGLGGDRMELDHIIPWSSGGPDTGANLRVLCEPCNQERGNFRTFEPISQLPVTLICDACIVRHGQVEHDSPHGVRYDMCPICSEHNFDWTIIEQGRFQLAFCGSCRTRARVTDARRIL
ncbi:HNH endonuclease [Actinokineospora cianjurensis]|uniref:HNH endonuclease n=1 Tax=Actinokineospora cianjurensis TaxID=585224 RepID=A0A421B6E3_9PSEU|nr:HNH endonuclease [Actinokineospora cianjurensis]RLK59865.1 HNH endonuclease [Actinokineospora cianjurensis]